VDDGTISTCELSDKASSAQEHQVDLHIADQTLGGVHQLVQSLQSHLLLSWLVHRKRCSADHYLRRVESRGMTPIMFIITCFGHWTSRSAMNQLLYWRSTNCPQLISGPKSTSKTSCSSSARVFYLSGSHYIVLQ
jgi:hypothetical protein